MLAYPYLTLRVTLLYLSRCRTTRARTLHTPRLPRLCRWYPLFSVHMSSRSNSPLPQKSIAFKTLPPSSHSRIHPNAPSDAPPSLLCIAAPSTDPSTLPCPAQPPHSHSPAASAHSRPDNTVPPRSSGILLCLLPSALPHLPPYSTPQNSSHCPLPPHNTALPTQDAFPSFFPSVYTLNRPSSANPLTISSIARPLTLTRPSYALARKFSQSSSSSLTDITLICIVASLMKCIRK
jgi:hypothetical protein